MNAQELFEEWVVTTNLVKKYGAKLHKGRTGRYLDLRVEQRYIAFLAGYKLALTHTGEEG